MLSTAYRSVFERTTRPLNLPASGRRRSFESEALRPLLGLIGHSIEVATNGEEAVQVSRREVFDLVLMDIKIPVTDGFEVLAEIRKRAKSGNRHIPVIAIPPQASGSDRERCVVAGFGGAE
jgi:CheY-like chemotaxis protein